MLVVVLMVVGMAMMMTEWARWSIDVPASLRRGGVYPSGMVWIGGVFTDVIGDHVRRWRL